MKQILAMLPPIDADRTREAVERALAEALLIKLSTFDEERREAKITASYDVRYHGSTNQTSDSTADVALHNVEQEEARKAKLKKMEWAISKLSKKQRELINLRYMNEFGIYDKDVYDGMMFISHTTYTKIRTEAFYLLAFFLKIYVEAGTDGQGQSTKVVSKG